MGKSLGNSENYPWRWVNLWRKYGETTGKTIGEKNDSNGGL